MEGVEAVDSARDAVEGDALEADFADELGGGGRVGGWWRRGGDFVEDR